MVITASLHNKSNDVTDYSETLHYPVHTHLA